MNNIKKYRETTRHVVYETATHKFKIKEDKIDKLIEDHNLVDLKKVVQKGMKQIVDKSTGEFWEENYQDIYKQILADNGFKTLNDPDFGSEEVVLNEPIREPKKDIEESGEAQSSFE